MRAGDHLPSETYSVLLTSPSLSGIAPLTPSVHDLPNTGPVGLFSIFSHNCS
jgi:hypothetical protein